MVKTHSKFKRQQQDEALSYHEETGGYSFMDVEEGEEDIEEQEEEVLSDMSESVVEEGAGGDVAEIEEERISKLPVSERASVDRNLDDFDNIDMANVCDQPRQKILSKENFPRDCVAKITKEERINFSRQQDADSKPPVLTVHLKFLLDFEWKNCERNDLNFGETMQMFCLPLRFQNKFEGVSIDRLAGGLLFSPKSSQRKWANSRDVSKSSLPLCFVLNNAIYHVVERITTEVRW